MAVLAEAVAVPRALQSTAGPYWDPSSIEIHQRTKIEQLDVSKDKCVQ